MNGIHAVPVSLVLAFLCLDLAAPSPCPAAEEGCLASGCHQDLSRGRSVHDPVSGGDCLACHEKKGDAHPAPGQRTFSLSAQGGGLCAQCHDVAGVKKRRVHGPAASGACTECHDPHRSDENRLLRMPLQGLCARCHTELDPQGIQGAAVVHAPLRKAGSCLACHDAHGSDFRGLLRGKMPDFCLQCHNRIRDRLKAGRRHAAVEGEKACVGCHAPHSAGRKGLLPREEKEICLDCHGKDDTKRSKPLKNIKKELETKKEWHGPIREGSCSPCHDPHGSNNPRLLTGPYPESFYAPFTQGAYDFCLGCHDRNMLRFADTTVYTNFRNGPRNLHYVHVADPQKGRTCRACHEPHASTGPRLISQEGMPFGGWQIPIRFAVTETGGSCAPGCHAPLSYDRVRPVEYGEGGGGKKEEAPGRP